MDPTLDRRLHQLEITLEQLQSSVSALQLYLFGAQRSEKPFTTPNLDLLKPGWQAPAETEPAPRIQQTLPLSPQVPAAPVMPTVVIPAVQATKRPGVYKVQTKREKIRPTASTRFAPALPSRASKETLALPQASTPSPRTGGLPSATAMLRRTEFWLNKVGIVLFLCGVVFLFKYAIDNQWISEEERLAAGVLLGTILLIAGLRVHSARRHFSQVLAGGAIATYYITGYAAYNIFPDLRLPYQAIFAFMGVATLIAFAVSLWGDDPSLSLIGLIGGLLTPFVLDVSQVHLPFLMTYTSLLLAGTSAIYIYRGWRSLLWTSFVGGWAMLSFGWWLYEWNFHFDDHRLNSDSAFLQIGAIAVLLASWAAPVLREVLTRYGPPRHRTADGELQRNSPANKAHAYILTAFTPFLVFIYSVAVWPSDLVSSKGWGWIALGGTALFLLTGWLLRRADVRLAYLHALVAIGLLNIGLVLLLEGNTLLLALAAQATLLHLVSFRYKDKGTEVAGTLIFGVAGIWILQRLIPTTPAQFPNLLNTQALTDLTVLGLALAASFFVSRPQVQLAYRGFVHVALLAWLWREIHGFPNGDGYVMLAWAAYGILLHLAARKLDTDSLTTKGISIAAHLAFEGALGLLAYRLTTGYAGLTPIFNRKAAIDLIMMGMALFSSFMVEGKRTAAAYRLVAHAAVLAWLWREAGYADITSGYVMLRWAAYTAVVAFVSHRLRDRITLLASSAPFIVVGSLLAWRLTDMYNGSVAIFNTGTLINFATLVLALAVSFIAQPRTVSIALRVGFHLGVICLLLREVGRFDHTTFYLMIAWAAYAALLYVIVQFTKDSATRWTAHALAAIVGAWMLGKIALGLILHNANATPVLNQQGLTELGVLVLAAMLYWIVRGNRYIGLAYGLWMHLVILGWTWQELGLLPDGNGPVTIAWGVYALVLIGASLRLERNRTLLILGVSTLFLLAAKLFLIDLVMYHIDVVWRILLFLGFGGLFLLVSYFFQNVVRRAED